MFTFNKFSGTLFTIIGFVMGSILILHGGIVYDNTNILIGLVLWVLATIMLGLTITQFGLILDPFLLQYCFSVTGDYKKGRINPSYFVSNYFIYIPRDMPRLKMIKLAYSLEQSIYDNTWI